MTRRITRRILNALLAHTQKPSPDAPGSILGPSEPNRAQPTTPTPRNAPQPPIVARLTPGGIDTREDHR